MASSARSEEDCKEFFDDPATLRAKIKQLAALVKSSKHFCALTGAGISTSAGIADFRSGLSTSLATGAGAWAKAAAIQKGMGAQIKPAAVATRIPSAIPTKAHMSLVSLMRSEPKYLKYLVSTNCDGLHRRSGVPVDRLSEVHGNSFLEACNICSTGYFRDYRVSNRGQKGKRTGRKCTVSQCGGDLCKTVVGFKQHCPMKAIARSWENINQCDVLLALGTSLTVSTVRAFAYEIVHQRHLRAKKAKQKERHHLLRDDARSRRHNADSKKAPERERHLVVVNIQKTVFDDLCSVRIFAKIDDVMVGLMKELALDVPGDGQWRLQRFLKLGVAPKMADSAEEESARRLRVSAMDVDGTSHTVFKNVKLRNDGEAVAEVMGAMTPSQRRCQEIFEFDIPEQVVCESKDNEDQDADADNADDANVQANSEEKDETEKTETETKAEQPTDADGDEPAEPTEDVTAADAVGDDSGNAETVEASSLAESLLDLADDEAVEYRQEIEEKTQPDDEETKKQRALERYKKKQQRRLRQKEDARRRRQEAVERKKHDEPTEESVEVSSLELKNDDDEVKEADEAEILPSPVHRRPKDDESPSPNSKAMQAMQQAEAAPDNGLVLSLGFFGHYDEPRLRIRLNEFLSGLGNEGGEVVCRLRMNVTTKQWTVEKIDFVPEPTVKEKYSFTKKAKKGKANRGNE